MTRAMQSSTSPRRGGLVMRTWVAVLTVMALGLVWTGPASGAAPVAVATGAISGTVTGPGGPAVGARVSAYDSATGASGGPVTADAAGSYVISGLPAGQYVVSFDGATTGFVSEYYNNRLQPQDADRVTVTAGATTSGINAVLAGGGGIAGTVTGPGGPAQFVWVGVTGTTSGYYDGVYTAADGTYHLIGLPADTYRVQFNGVFADLASEYYDDSFRWDGADLVSVTVGLTTVGINASLLQGGSVSGVVRGPAGPVEGVHVSVYDLVGGGYGNTLTAADGSYTVVGLAPGTYVVAFHGPSGAGLRAEYYDNQVAESLATPLPFSIGQDRTGIDATLALESSPLFSDVPAGAPFSAEIEWLALEGITSGYPDGTFHPSAPVERQAMAAFLYRFAGEPSFTPPATATFSDVPVGSPFFTEIEWLVDSGITTGWPDGTFRPTATVERQAMAAFLYRYAGEPAFTDPATASFPDVPTSAQFFTEIEWLADTGITTGWPDHTFRPSNTVERQAMAAFLMRFDTWLWS